MAGFVTGSYAVSAMNALQSIPQNDQLVVDAMADFIEISYGYKRRVMINPNASIRHIREFLGGRMADNYLEDFVTYVTNYKTKEQERAEESGGNESLHTNRKHQHNKNPRKKATSRVSSAREDAGKKDLEGFADASSINLVTQEKQKIKVTTDEAYEWMLQRQTAKLEKKYLAKLERSDNEEHIADHEENSDASACTEILDFMTEQGELLCLYTFERENLHHAVALNSSHNAKQLTRDNNTFILARVKLVYGEVREVTPLIVNPVLLQELLPLCSAWLRHYVQTTRRKKEAIRKIAEAQAERLAQQQPSRRKKGDRDR